MRETILGRKLGMSQIFDRNGNAVPVTLVQAGPCSVLQVKTTDSDGYNAIQLGFMDRKDKHTNRPLKGHVGKSGSTPKRHIRESRVEDVSRYQVGMVLTAGIFRKDDVIDVTGTSKGKGFAGVMKRHGFAGFEQSHGVHESYRGPGSIGAAADPARVFPGRRMPGQMGRETVTVQNLRVVDVREDQNILVIRGPVPGGRNGLLVISHAIKKPAPEVRELVTARPEPAEEPADEAPAAAEAVEAAETEETAVAAPADAEAPEPEGEAATKATEEATEAAPEETPAEEPVEADAVEEGSDKE